MPHVQSGTWHHCPGLSQKVDGYPGPCRIGPQDFCVVHNVTCPVHPHWYHTMKQKCLLCLKKDALDDKKEKEKERRKTEGDEEPEEKEYTTETRTEIINGKHKKVTVKVEKNPAKKTTANMVSKDQKMKSTRRKQRIEVLAQKLPDLDLDGNPFQDVPGKPLPMPSYEELRIEATKMVDRIGWMQLRPILVNEGISEESLPPISPELPTAKAGRRSDPGILTLLNELRY